VGGKQREINGPNPSLSREVKNPRVKMVIEITAQEYDGSDKRGQHAKPVGVLVFILDEPKTG
jgi:hypothetical protein